MSKGAFAGGLVIGLLAALIQFIWNKYQANQENERDHAYPGSFGGHNGRAGAPPEPSDCCSVCQDQLTAPLEILPCGHIFHNNCIRECLRRRMSCPNCRYPMTGQIAIRYNKRLNL